MTKLNLFLCTIMMLFFGWLAVIHPVTKMPNRIIECKRNTPKAIWFTVEGVIEDVIETGWSNYRQETVYIIRLTNGSHVQYQGICKYK